MDESFCGFDLLGADAVVTIPTAGASYTDAKTVTAVQFALVKKGYNVGDSGPNRDGIDGLFGSKTKKAILKMQSDLHMTQTGKIDEGVISTLKVTPGVLPPGVTAAGRAAVQAQVALDAATRAEHAVTPTDVQAAAQELVEVTPAQPPELKQAAVAALGKAKAATTPAQIQAAAAEIKSIAENVHEAVKPSWWMSPAWSGGPPRWEPALFGSAGGIGLGGLLWAVLR